MTKNFHFQNPELFQKIKTISNPARFKILELTQEKELNVTEIGKNLKITYKRCSEYIKKLEKLKMVNKIKKGKNVYIRSRVGLNCKSISFLKE